MTRFLDFEVIFSPLGKFGAGTNRPEPAPAGKITCRLSCTVSCIFPGRRCFSPQRVVLYFYLYPRGFMGECPENSRGVVKIGGTKRPVLTLGEHRRHSGHKTRNALGLERGAWVRLPPSPPEGRPVRHGRTSFFAFRRRSAVLRVIGGREHRVRNGTQEQPGTGNSPVPVL